MSGELNGPDRADPSGRPRIRAGSERRRSSGAGSRRGLGGERARPRPAASPTPAPAASPALRRAGDVITAEQIAAVPDGNGYEVLARLRPELVRREIPIAYGGSSGGPLIVYVDGIRQGTVGLLADIRAGVIAEMRYYLPGDALAWFGPGHEGGVLAVRIRK